MENKVISPEIFCLFVGYPRSGHSLIGSIIDAHPNAIIAHEYHALGKFDKLPNKETLYSKLIDNSKISSNRGRKGKRLYGGGKVGRYSYVISGQGMFDALKVIGDKRGFSSTKSIQECSNILQIFRNFIGIDLRILHVIRDPYDNITTMSRILGRNAYQAYGKACDTLDGLRARENMLDIYIEHVIRNPKQQIARICEYLGLSSPNPYLSKCAKIVFKTPHHTKEERDWKSTDLETINDLVDKFNWLTYKKWKPKEKTE